MDEQNVVTTTTDAAENTVEQTATIKTEQVKEVKADSAEVQRLKAALSKANGEAAEYKRQLREKQSAAERAEAERAEAEQAMRTELETLRKDKAITDYTNKALEVGFDADNAAKAANALADGNMDGLFDCLKAFVEATKTRLNNEALNRQPGLSAGIPPTTNTVGDEEYAKLCRYAGLSPHR